MLRNGYTLSLTPAMYSPWISNRLIANEYKKNMCVFLNSVPPKEDKEMARSVRRQGHNLV